MFCNTFLRHLDVMMVIYLLLMKIQRFWYYAEYDGSKTLLKQAFNELLLWYYVKYNSFNTLAVKPDNRACIWYYVKYDSFKTS